MNQIEAVITPLLTVHGVELVALDWLQGPGHGILRVFIDRPGGDPRTMDPDKSVSLDEVTHATRDISATMDALDLIEEPYTLEVGSPGPERPVQKREDFERFVGLEARIDVRGPSREKATLRGILRACVATSGGFVIRLEAGGKIHEIPSERLVRAKLIEIAAPKGERLGKIPSRRQERLAAREQARAINAAHRAALHSTPVGLEGPTNVARSHTTEAETESTHDTNLTNRPADSTRAAKR